MWGGSRCRANFTGHTTPPLLRRAWHPSPGIALENAQDLVCKWGRAHTGGDQCGWVCRLRAADPPPPPPLRLWQHHFSQEMCRWVDGIQLPRGGSSVVMRYPLPPTNSVLAGGPVRGEGRGGGGHRFPRPAGPPPGGFSATMGAGKFVIRLAFGGILLTSVDPRMFLAPSRLHRAPSDGSQREPWVGPPRPTLPWLATARETEPEPGPIATPTPPARGSHGIGPGPAANPGYLSKTWGGGYWGRRGGIAVRAGVCVCVCTNHYYRMHTSWF